MYLNYSRSVDNGVTKSVSRFSYVSVHPTSYTYSLGPVANLSWETMGATTGGRASTAMQENITRLITRRAARIPWARTSVAAEIASELLCYLQGT